MSARKATLTVAGAEPGAAVRVKQVSHRFLFGCNFFAMDTIPEEEVRDLYRRRFTDLLNYCTLPFYWGGYEGKPGEKQEARLRAMAEWAVGHGLVCKGHPLVWHEVVPKWCPGDPVEVEKLLRARVAEIVSRFNGLIDVWDVTNETTVSHRFQNGVGRWVAKLGAAEATDRAVRWAREAAPGASICVNDFNVGDDHERLIADLVERDCPFDVIGVQSHMHRGVWPEGRVGEVVERYARFGKPIHFTETTILSGALKTDDDWHRVRTDWHSTPEGESRQAEDVERFYRELWAREEVEAATWWDFSDRASWQGAPAGLVRKDMSPKPIYERLQALIKDEWWTDRELKADASGEARIEAMLGGYEVSSGERRVTHEHAAESRVALA